MFELSKQFGVPIDSEVLKNINETQLLWYAYMFKKQREDEFAEKVDITEYLASFINAEAVQKVRDAKKNTKKVSDADFERILREEVGKVHYKPINNKPKKKGIVTLEDLKKYTNLPLEVEPEETESTETDEIIFTPKKG